MDFYKKKKEICLDWIPEKGVDEIGFEQEVWMKEMVNTLPEELKTVVILRFYQELRYQDIACILQISVSLAKYRVKKAVQMLQKEWEGDKI